MVIKWAGVQGFYSCDDPVELVQQVLPKVKILI